jgi:hypothetical protein
MSRAISRAPSWTERSTLRAGNQPLGHTPLHRRLEHLAQQIALAEATVPVLREGRMVRHSAVQPKPTEPAVSEVQVNFLAQSPLLRPVLALGYTLVVANRRFLFGVERRILWLKATVLIAFCLGLGISSHCGSGRVPIRWRPLSKAFRR